MAPAYQLDYQVEVEKPQDHSVKTSKRKQKSQIPAVAVICCIAVMLVSCAIFYLNQQVTSMQLFVQINNLEQKRDTLKREQGHLVIELQQASRLASIEAIARHQLGMVDPVGAEMLVMAPKNNQVTIVENGWIETETSESVNNSFFVAVADWLNQLLPVGGVEAGRIGE